MINALFITYISMIWFSLNQPKSNNFIFVSVTILQTRMSASLKIEYKSDKIQRTVQFKSNKLASTLFF